MPTLPSQQLQSALEKKLSDIEKARIESQAQEIAQKSGFPYLNVGHRSVDLAALAILEEAEARTSQAAVIAKEKQTLQLAVTDPQSTALKNLSEKLTSQGFTLKIVVVSSLGLEKILTRYQDLLIQKEETLGTVNIDPKVIAEAQKEIQNIGDLKEKLASLATSQLLETLIAGAIKTGASDLHLEPAENVIRVRYRLDGILHDITDLDLVGYQKLLPRIKITSHLKINVRNAPQDGRFSVSLGNKNLEIRVSVLPGANGENVVMRLLDPDALKQNIQDLGFSDEQLALVQKFLQKPTGSILTTGPTGSGKTTTLYAFLQHINEPGSKIITIEDPVEYRLPGISQTQVNPAQGYTFASGLRSIVRQDPDIILVGEIRDGETAEIAMQAALTGHLVFSTLHTNDAAGAIPRLIDLGAKPVSIAPALSVVIAQRLVRKLCPECRQKKTVNQEDYAMMKEILAGLTVKDFSQKSEIFYPSQCTACNSTGYRGRIGIFEFFVVDKEIEQTILKSPSVSEMKDLAIKKGMVTMAQDGYLKALKGITSTEEVQRVVG